MERPHFRDTYVPPNRRVAASAGRVSLGPSCGRGQAGALFDELADALAVMAFSPGGISFLGTSWEA
jgi:hypothetical protein